jgi:hypothetical protein
MRSRSVSSTDVGTIWRVQPPGAKYPWQSGRSPAASRAADGSGGRKGSRRDRPSSRHLDRRAADLLTGSCFTIWARTMAGVVADRDFLTRRLYEWTLLRTIALDNPWTAEELTGATDWCQRITVTTQLVTSPKALGLLAERGRTRRVRNAASRRLRDRGRPG